MLHIDAPPRDGLELVTQLAGATAEVERLQWLGAPRTQLFEGGKRTAVRERIQKCSSPAMPYPGMVG